MAMRHMTSASWRVMITVLGVIATGLSGRAAALPDDGRVFGAGMIVCREWLAPSPDRAVGNTWVEGYWSALNVAYNRATGGDQAELLSRVAAMCKRSPSEKIYVAAIGAWVRAKNGDPE